MIDKETFKKVGYLDESLPYRYHDQDYSIKVKKAGLSVNRTGNVIVHHTSQATYDAMGRHGNAEEEIEMRRLYGVTTFNEWKNLQSSQ